jgi:hypothetical protein
VARRMLKSEFTESGGNCSTDATTITKLLLVDAVRENMIAPGATARLSVTGISAARSSGSHHTGPSSKALFSDGFPALSGTQTTGVELKRLQGYVTKPKR